MMVNSNIEGNINTANNRLSKIKKAAIEDDNPKAIKVKRILLETLAGHSFLSIKLSLTSLKYMIYKLLAEKKVSILKVVQKIANAAKSLNDNLYAKKDVSKRNKNLPKVLPKRFKIPKLFFMYVLNSLFKLLLYCFFSISK